MNKPDDWIRELARPMRASRSPRIDIADRVVTRIGPRVAATAVMSRLDYSWMLAASLSLLTTVALALFTLLVWQDHFDPLKLFIEPLAMALH